MAWNREAQERRIERIRRLKEQVFALIGRTCHVCGHKPARLDIDHVDGRSWLIRHHNQETRWKIYLQEAREGMVRPACPPCNKRQGARLRYTYLLPAPPF